MSEANFIELEEESFLLSLFEKNFIKMWNK